MQPDFSPEDLDEARRFNEKLAMLPPTADGDRARTGRAERAVAGGRALSFHPRRPNERDPLLEKDRGARSTREAANIPAGGECRGVVLDYHGGGWTIGNARMGDDQNAELAARLGVAVVSVDYRLALSNPIVAQVDDCEAAAVWTMERAMSEFGTDRIVVKGSSAGAHLAAATLLRLRDRGGLIPQVAGAVLFFGLYEFAGTAMLRAAGSETLVLHGPTVRTTLSKLTPGMSEDERRDPTISPLYADLSNLPPALFAVGTKDMLLEDNERMAARWWEASGNSELLIAPESPHAFNRMGTAVAGKIERYVDAWILERLGAVAPRGHPASGQ